MLFGIKSKISYNSFLISVWIWNIIGLEKYHALMIALSNEIQIICVPCVNKERNNYFYILTMHEFSEAKIIATDSLVQNLPQQ